MIAACDVVFLRPEPQAGKIFWAAVTSVLKLLKPGRWAWVAANTGGGMKVHPCTCMLVCTPGSKNTCNQARWRAST